MTAINFASPVAPAVNLNLNNWSDRAKSHGALASWWTLHSGRWTESSGRITGCAARVGPDRLTKAAASLGPVPAAVQGFSCADFNNNELAGLHCERSVPRDGLGFAAILWLGSVAPTQNRDLMGFYGAGDAMRIWRNPSTGWSWRAGSSDAALVNRPWAEGPLMILGERIGTTCRLRVRDRTGASTEASGTLTTSIPTTVRAIFGQDEISDGHTNANPSAARTWSEYLMEAAIYSGAVLTDAAVAAFWENYFTAVYQSAS